MFNSKGWGRFLGWGVARNTSLLFLLLWASAYGQYSLLSQKDGAAPDDRFGYSVAGAGDVNGDGVPDYIIGAPYADPGGLSAAGSAYIYSGAGGTLLYQKNGSAINEALGLAVAGAGDVNSDGRDDFIVATQTQAFVYSGATGSLLYQKGGGGPVAGAGDVNGDGRDDFMVSALTQAYVYSGATGNLLYQKSGGSAVAGIGDVNGDYRPDFLVSDQYADPGLTNAGSVYIYSGADGSLLYQKNGAADYDRFGRSAAAAGDVNGDGRPDLIVGAYLADAGGLMDAGAVYVYSGPDGALLYQKNGTGAGMALGTAVAGAGDVDGDGRSDFLVGTTYAAPGGLSGAGSVFLYSGSNGSLLSQFNGYAAYDNLGHALAGVGDLNGNGRADFIISAPTADPGGRFNAGSAYIYGNSSGGGPCQPDINPPTITCVADKQVVCGAAVVFDQPTATDNCDAIPTINIVSTTQSTGPGPGEITHTRTWTATDDAGNVSAPCSQKVVESCNKFQVYRSQVTQASVTCGSFASSTSADLTQACYSVRKDKISKTSPSTFFYYIALTAPSSSFTVDVIQTRNNAGFPFFGVARNGVTVYDASCNVIGTGNSTGPGQAQASVSGAAIGQQYIVSVKYSGSSLVGTYAGPNLPMVHYDFSAMLNGAEFTQDLDGLNLAGCTGAKGGNGLAAELQLEGNHPNPFNATTSIRFSIPQDAQVRLEIYNILGQRVRTLIDEFRSAGAYSVIWDGTDGSGNGVASGVYFYKISSADESQVGRMNFLK